MPWRLTSTPPHTWLTASCAVCFAGTEARTEWFDGDILIEGEGSFLICRECVEEAGALAGMVAESDTDALLTRALEAETENEKLTGELVELRSLVEGLRRYDAAATAAPVADAGVGASSSADPERVAAAADAEMAKPVMPHKCPGCTRAFVSEASLSNHVARKHGHL